MRRTYATMYRLGLVPWDRADIPPPLVRVADDLMPTTAVDLGCGTGGQARYLSDRGWSVTAVDFVPRAISLARRHDHGGLVDWRVADVAQVDTVDPDGRLRGQVGLLLDNGCAHGLTPTPRTGWAQTVTALAATGATLLVRAQPANRTTGRRRLVGPGGIDGADLLGLLVDAWTPLDPPAPTWYRLVRRPEN